MRKQFIQQSNSQKRAKNFFDTITSDDTLQIIVEQDNSGTFLLWQDEYYMELYLAVCNMSIKLSKVNTINFLKWLKGNKQDLSFLIHPVFGQECLALNAGELSKKIVSNMDSDGDYYDTLRQNDLL